MDDLIAQVGVGGIFAVLVIREVLNFLTKRNGADKDKGGKLDRVILAALQEMKPKLDELHKWHDQRDQDGVPVWYIRRSLEEAVDKLAESQQMLSDNIRNMTIILERLATNQDEMRREVHSLEDDLARRHPVT